MLPSPLVKKLKDAAAVTGTATDRRKAIEAAIAWGREHYPQHFQPEPEVPDEESADR